MVATAEGNKRVVDNGLDVGTIGRDRAEEGGEQLANRARLHIAGNEDEPGSRIGVGPGRQGRRWVEDVLDAVNDDRLVRRLGELHHAFQAQELRPVQGAQQVEEHVEHRCRHGRLGHDREGADVIVVTVAIVMMLMLRTGLAIRLGREPARHVRSEEHTSELQSRGHLVCRLLLEKKKKSALDAYLKKKKKMKAL